MGKLSIQAYTIKDISNNHAILDKYKDPFGYIKKCNETWIQILRSNAYAKGSDIALILTIDDDIVVGRLGLYAASVIYNQKEEQTFWLSGFFLNEKYKNSGAGGLMLLKAISFCKCLLAAGGPRNDTQQLYKATGFYELGYLKRFIYFYQSKVIAKRYVRNLLISSFLSIVSSPILKLYYKMKIGQSKPILTYKPVKSFGVDIDSLFTAQTLDYFPRCSDSLNWILQNKKNIHAFQIFRDQKLIGYCILGRTYIEVEGSPHYYPEKIDGNLLDYYIVDQSKNVKRDLILFCLEFFKREKVDIFECRIFDEDIARICLQYGMIHKGENRIFFRPSPHNKLQPGNRWFLTHGTGDEILIGE